MTMTAGQTSMPAQPQQQPKKEKHLVHWFRKGMTFCSTYLTPHILRFIDFILTVLHFLGLRLHDNPALREGN